MMQRQQLRHRMRRQWSGQGSRGDKQKRKLVRIWLDGKWKKSYIMSPLKFWACAFNHTGVSQSLVRECKHVLPFSLIWSEFTCQLSPTGIGQHLGGKCGGIFQKTSRLGAKNILVCMRVLCLSATVLPTSSLYTMTEMVGDPLTV